MFVLPAVLLPELFPVSGMILQGRKGSSESRSSSSEKVSHRFWTPCPGYDYYRYVHMVFSMMLFMHSIRQKGWACAGQTDLIRVAGPVDRSASIFVHLFSYLFIISHRFSTYGFLGVVGNTTALSRRTSFWPEDSEARAKASACGSEANCNPVNLSLINQRDTSE